MPRNDPGAHPFSWVLGDVHAAIVPPLEDVKIGLESRQLV